MFRIPRLRCVHAALVCILILAGVDRLLADDAQAEMLLKQGRVDEASAVLKQILTSQPDDSKAHLLLCRVYYSQDMGDAAVPECELAAAGDPENSDNQWWLGRAYGLQASQANLLSAFSIAKKVRTAFVRAVELDPSNVAAMSALGQYYVEAPAIVGGGLDKAQAVAAQLEPYSAEKAHRLLGMIANKRKDMETAEAEFKGAVAAGRTPEAYVDLAQFYQEHSQPDKAVDALNASIEANRARDAALVDVASLLITMHRSPDVAERVLREYLASPAKSDEAPAFKVHVQLGDLLLQKGDTASARREYTTALALASGYAPARRALQKT